MREVVAVHDVNPGRERAAERVVGVIDGARLKRVVVPGKKEGGPSLPHRRELLGDRLPPLTVGTRLIEQVAGTEDGVDVVVVGSAEDVVEHVDSRACESDLVPSV